MNDVALIGRLTKDPEITRNLDNNQTIVGRFTLAIDRPARAGQEKKTDFPRILVFGRQAENCEKFLAKGRLVGVQGRIQTGSYTNKDGQIVYTTDVVAEKVEFLEWANTSAHEEGPAAAAENIPPDYSDYPLDGVPEGHQTISDEDIPLD